MKEVFSIILPYVWLPVYALGIYGCAVSLIKADKFAEKKNYTPEQKKKYLLTWTLAFILLLFLTVLEIRDIPKTAPSGRMLGSGINNKL